MNHIRSAQVSTAIAVLMTCSIAYIVNDLYMIKTARTRELAATANVLSWSLVTAIEFQDDKDAMKTLSSLQQNPNFVSALVYTSDGKLFAHYEKTGMDPVFQESLNQNRSEYKIKDHAQEIGKLTLITEDSESGNQYLRYLLIVFGATISGLALSILFANYFSKMLSSSILDLIMIIRRITERKNYSVRLKDEGLNSKILEVRTLEEEFDKMIEQIEARDRSIQATNENLENLVEERTAALVKTQQELVQNGRLSALGEMAAGIAHEINNPLAIIAGRCGVLIRKIQTEKDSVSLEMVEKDIHKIDDMANRINKIIRGLRSFSRDGSADPFEKVSFRLIIDDALELCSAKLKSIGVEVEVNGSLDTIIECRATQIGQVLFNLIGNSRDAIEHLSPKWIKVEANLPRDNILKITLTDSGHGIPATIREKILQPFFTTKEVGKGTGLGLSISVGIIKAHHGTFTINADHPHTQFIIELPIHQPTTA